jgi:DNA-binding CsgD family transcriptional regulator
MSDSGNDAGASAAAGASPAFTEREMQMLAWAMQSLKSGPPDVGFPLI